MTGKTLKATWITLGILILILCFITIVWTDAVMKYLSPSHLILISALLCLPFFIAKIKWEENNPPKQWQKYLGWLILICVILYFIYALTTYLRH